MTLDQARATAELLSLRALGAEFLPETVCMLDGGELHCRYELTRKYHAYLTASRKYRAYLTAIKINGIWHDPVAFGLSDGTIVCLENECAESAKASQ